MITDCLMPTSVGEVVELSEKMSGSQFCRQKGLVREADCLAVLLAGNCLGLSPIESIQLVSTVIVMWWWVLLCLSKWHRSNPTTWICFG